MFIFLLLVSLAFGIARFIVPVEGKINKKDIFKDMAHLWVGFLFGAAAFSIHASVWEAPAWWALPIGLTVLEVAAFFIRKT